MATRWGLEARWCSVVLSPVVVINMRCITWPINLVRPHGVSLGNFSGASWLGYFPGVVKPLVSHIAPPLSPQVGGNRVC